MYEEDEQKRGVYNNRDHPKHGGEARRLIERREAPGMREELGIPVLGREALSPWDVGPSGSVYFSPPKQVVASSEPNFGPILYKFIVMGPVQKPRPYNWRRLWKSCSCDDECNSLLRRGQIP